MLYLHLPKSFFYFKFYSKFYRMTTQASLFMLLTQSSIILITAYFFYKVFRKGKL
jgi:hypothetical protein